MNGRMYTLIDKEDKLSIRLNKEDTEEYASKYEVQPSIQHNSVMKEYVLVPQKMLENDKYLKYFFNKSYEYFNGMPPKSTKKKK
ncbi:MAG: hypothetical protein ACI8XB_002827 [Patiriisocius sp.]